MNTDYETRLTSEGGFTLIKLLVVVQILAILTLLAVPQFIGMSAKARVAATESNVRSAIPSATTYYLDTVNNPTPNTFGGISGAKLRLEAPGISPKVKAGARTVVTSNDAFCIQDSENGGTTIYRYEGGTGGAATLLAGACPAAYAAT